jgi:hypothetical protein
LQQDFWLIFHQRDRPEWKRTSLFSCETRQTRETIIMSNWIKVILIISVCFVLLIVGVIGLGAYWWSRHKDELIGSAKNARTEGAAFGRKTDAQGCLDEGVRRHKEHHGFSDSILNNLFLGGCFEATRPTSGFCDGVPRSTEMMESVRWRLKRCTDAGLSDNYCGNLFAEVQKYCDSYQSKPATSP